MTSEQFETHILSGREIPEHTTVVGNVSCNGWGNVKLPKHLTIDGFLSVKKSDITELPDNLTVLSFLMANDDTKVVKVPKNLTVKGFFYVGENIKYIPKCANLSYDLVPGRGVYFRHHAYSRDDFNRLRADDIMGRPYFLREKIVTLQKLIEIPELYQEVYYTHKKMFLSLLKKI